MSKTGRIYITKISKIYKINNFFYKKIYPELNNIMIDWMNLPSSIDGVKSRNIIHSPLRLHSRKTLTSSIELGRFIPSIILLFNNYSG